MKKVGTILTAVLLLSSSSAFCSYCPSSPFSEDVSNAEKEMEETEKKIKLLKKTIKQNPETIGPKIINKIENGNGAYIIKEGKKTSAFWPVGFDEKKKKMEIEEEEILTDKDGGVFWAGCFAMPKNS